MASREGLLLEGGGGGRVSEGVIQTLAQRRLPHPHCPLPPPRHDNAVALQQRGGRALVLGWARKGGKDASVRRLCKWVRPLTTVVPPSPPQRGGKRVRDAVAGGGGLRGGGWPRNSASFRARRYLSRRDRPGERRDLAAGFPERCRRASGRRPNCLEMRSGSAPSRCRCRARRAGGSKDGGACGSCVAPAARVQSRQRALRRRMA